jgi:hypothetical protein
MKIQPSHFSLFLCRRLRFMQKMARNWLSWLSQKISRKAIGLIAASAILLVFGDTLVSMLGHGLHLLIEVLEQALEDILEAAFGLSKRQSQIVLFWTGLPSMAYLFLYLVRKLCFAARTRWVAIMDSARAVWINDAWIQVIVMLGGLGTVFYLIT